ncbi:PREDICTED: uncharacterized protein LOC105361152 [Ceratosolen solmsi marchali]|uniref:Uncharacterized protein LOC105361152 n=1 Tax=Ceratosolen solmsi marchali TaxID=326594 RepID=A0AAJ7DU49_9HYME|nr:PREDICTED: uncharacterized protein LOC105361152 [Ceratosolen solmsi marchali]
MSCFGGRDDLIYLVELNVDRLRLTASKYQEDFSDTPPLVKLKFIDFPVFVIKRSDLACTPRPYDENKGLVYAAGKSCLFVKKPRDLVTAMQLQPLKLGIFRCDETFPIAEASIPLSGCLCDQIAMARNDSTHMPKPYELTGNYNIADPGNNYAGSINILLRLTLFGSYIVSHYQIFDDSYEFKNNFNEDFRIKKPPEQVLREHFESPASPPRPAMNKTIEQNHHCLGTQRGHLSKLWAQIPPTSSSSYSTSSSYVFKPGQRRPEISCSLHSVRCSSARQHFKDTRVNEHLIAGPGKNDRRSAEAPARLRGGGSNDLDYLLKTDADFMWRNNKFITPTRLEGGGCCGRTASPPTTNDKKATWEHQNENNNSKCVVGNKCRNVEKIPKPVHCAEQQHEEKKEFGICMKKPCMGTDCLIRAFKDTQDFVNSIGKVPGLAGLGIVESPYFGKTQELKENKKEELRPLSNHKQLETSNYIINPQNAENVKKSALPSLSYNSNPPKKLVVVQEAITTFVDPTQASKWKKKDEKIEKQKESENNSQAMQINEDSPCGEPKCKSRPKKNIDVENIDEKINNSGDKLSPKNDQTKSKTKSSVGTGGDLTKNSKSNPGKGNQFVYSFGNSYPTSVYGHKNCYHHRRRVPANQGWMWNEADTIANRKLRTGWKPGAISVLMRDMMNAAKAGFLNESSRPKSAPSRSKKNQKMIPFNTMKKPPTCNEEQTEEEASFPPTLHIHRRDGEYYITMYPIRQETSDVPRIDEPLNPLQFKIVKSKDSLATSSTASDMEIEFSPPAAVNRIKKKPNVVHIETNVNQQEILDELKKLSGCDKDGKNKKDKSKKKWKDPCL